MKVFVCLKRVPDTSEAELKVAAAGKSVDLSGLKFELNDADNYALEEAIKIKEATGGSAVAVVIGSKEEEVMIRTALARGCDSAIRIEPSSFKVQGDPLQAANILAAAIKGQEYDLVLTGCMASDDGFMATGVALAEELGASHAAMVNRVELSEGMAKVQRELEGGLGEVVEINLPAVLTIQTGINKPRYPGLKGVRAAQKKEIKVVTLENIGIDAEQLDDASRVELRRFYIPIVESHAEVIEGDAEAKAEKLADKIVKGGLA